MENEEDSIRCLCGNPSDDGFSIQCDICMSWLHAACVRITPRSVPDRFVCPRCTKSKTGRKKRPMEREPFRRIKRPNDMKMGVLYEREYEMEYGKGVSIDLEEGVVEKLKKECWVYVPDKYICEESRKEYQEKMSRMMNGNGVIGVVSSYLNDCLSKGSVVKVGEHRLGYVSHEEIKTGELVCGIGGRLVNEKMMDEMGGMSVYPVPFSSYLGWKMLPPFVYSIDHEDLDGLFVDGRGEMGDGKYVRYSCFGNEKKRGNVVMKLVVCLKEDEAKRRLEEEGVDVCDEFYAMDVPHSETRDCVMMGVFSLCDVAEGEELIVGQKEGCFGFPCGCERVVEDVAEEDVVFDHKRRLKRKEDEFLPKKKSGCFVAESVRRIDCFLNKYADQMGISIRESNGQHDVMMKLFQRRIRSIERKRDVENKKGIVSACEERESEEEHPLLELKMQPPVVEPPPQHHPQQNVEFRDKKKLLREYLKHQSNIRRVSLRDFLSKKKN